MGKLAYRVIQNLDLAEFERIVTQHINEGWVLQGGCSLTKVGVYVFCSQALVKEVESDSQLGR